MNGQKADCEAEAAKIEGAKFQSWNRGQKWMILRWFGRLDTVYQLVIQIYSIQLFGGEKQAAQVELDKALPYLHEAESACNSITKKEPTVKMIYGSSLYSKKTQQAWMYIHGHLFWSTSS